MNKKNASLPASLAQTIKADGMIRDGEVVFFRQLSLGFAYEFELLIEKFGIIHYGLAAQTDQVMVMFFPVGIVHQFVPGLPVSEIEFLDDPIWVNMSSVRYTVVKPIDGLI